LPSLHDGILAAVWTIQHAIRTQPGGVAEPIQIVSLCKDKDGNWTAQQLSRDEVDGHRLMIRAIEDKMQQFRKEVFQEQPTEPIP
jgi:Mg2+ and Co2+ transporter CorA